MGARGYAVELYFDAAAETRVRGLWQRLADAGVNDVMATIGARPHLSLAVYDRLDPAPVCEALRRFATTVPDLSSLLGAFGTFPGEEGVVFTSPVVTSELLSLHARYHGCFAHLDAACLAYYRPGRWFPHCTVAIDVDAAGRSAAIDVCHAVGVPGPFTVTAIGLIEFRPVRTHCVHPVGGARA
ncbi:MAG: 2'-5' RNA ligase family protein [Candidatus Eiseniibacteriota bacterium]|jgi:hypothetical protein